MQTAVDKCTYSVQSGLNTAQEGMLEQLYRYLLLYTPLYYLVPYTVSNTRFVLAKASTGSLNTSPMSAPICNPELVA